MTDMELWIQIMALHTHIYATNKILRMTDNNPTILKIELSVRNGAHKIPQLHRGWAGVHNLRHLGQGEKLGVRQESGHERCKLRVSPGSLESG